MLPFLVALSFLAVPFAMLPNNARAAEVTPVVGLVIDYGNGAYSYATIPVLPGDPPMDGVALLQRSGLPVLTISFGGYGAGICKIETTGCDVDVCRARLCQTADSRSPFWRYLIGGDDGWVMSPLGASGTRVEAGKVYAWSWSGGTGVPATPLLTPGEVNALSGFVDAGEPAIAVRSVGLPAKVSLGVSRRDYLAAFAILTVVAGSGAYLMWRTHSRRTLRSDAPC